MNGNLNGKKKSGCFWKLLKFTFFTLTALAVAGYFLCWHVPAFKLTPERVGWTLPGGAEVPLTPDGKYVDHAKAFELTYPEFYTNPHKNGWRKVLLAVSPEYFREDYGYAGQTAKHKAQWEEIWQNYYRLLDISPDQIEGVMPTNIDDEIEKAVIRQVLKEAKAFAAVHPEWQKKPGDEFLENEERRPLAEKKLCPLSDFLDYLYGDSKEVFQAELEEYGELIVPCSLVELYPQAVRHQLQAGAWNAVDFPELAACLETQAPLWETVAEAVREEVYYPLYGTCDSLIMPDNTFSRAMARGLAARSAMRHGSGDIPGALADVQTLVVMGRKLQQTPVQYAYWIGTSIESVGWSVVMNNLGSGAYSRENLAFISSLMENGEVRRQWREFLPYLKWYVYESAQKLKLEVKTYEWSSELRKFYQLSETHVFLARLAAKMPVDANQTLDAAVAAFREAEAGNTDALKAEVKTFCEKRSKMPRWQWLLSMALTANRTHECVMEVKGMVASAPDYVRVNPYIHQRDALLRAGLACQLYRMDKGEFPETLEALVPEYLAAVPEDAYRPGEKIKYRVEENAVVIYASGYDEKDDGGLWSEDITMEQYERMKNVDEEMYFNKYDTILRLKK